MEQFPDYTRYHIIGKVDIERKDGISHTLTNIYLTFNDVAEAKVGSTSFSCIALVPGFVSTRPQPITIDYSELQTIICNGHVLYDTLVQSAQQLPSGSADFE